MIPRPPLSQSFANALRESAKQRGWLAFIPYMFLACLAAGVLAGFGLPTKFWTNHEQQVSTTVYGGILAFNGLMLAVGGNGAAKIYEIITGPVIGPILRKHNLLDEHLTALDLNQFSFVGAAAATFAGMILLLTDAHILADRALFASSVGLSLYGILCTVSTTREMHALIWEQAHTNGPTLAAVQAGKPNDLAK